MIVTLYRRDFKTNQDDDSSFFEDVLFELGFKNKKDQRDIEEVEIKVESVTPRY